MPQDRRDRIREALTRLPTCDRAELTAEWLRLYHTKPPARLGRNLLMAAIAYRLQEQVLGGLQPELRRQLRAIAGRARHDGEPALAPAPRLKPGTKLLRDWRGHTHEVLVGENGFLWQQAQYRSLSQIARAITGTRWSGPVFFGLKPRTTTARATPS
jgi:Protein of unknown function (DUF2924)